MQKKPSLRDRTIHRAIAVFCIEMEYHGDGGIEWLRSVGALHYVTLLFIKEAVQLRAASDGLIGPVKWRLFAFVGRWGVAIRAFIRLSRWQNERKNEWGRDGEIQNEAVATTINGQFIVGWIAICLYTAGRWKRPSSIGTLIDSHYGFIKVELARQR